MTQYQNTTGNLKQRIILSAAFDPGRPDVTNSAFLNTALPPGERWRSRTIANYSSSNTNASAQEEAPNFYQDEVPWAIRQRTVGGDAVTGVTSFPWTSNTANSEHKRDRRNTSELTVANEFELDANQITHTFQSMTAVGPLPGIPKRTMYENTDTAQLTALAIDLGMMREIISVQGVLIDRTTHPSSESGHHARKQHLLDLLRTQYAFIHGLNRTREDPWMNINRFPALTIGIARGRYDISAGDQTYEGDQPSNDPRGIAVKGAQNLDQVADSTSRGIGYPSYAWDPVPTYFGRHRYRGLMRRLTLRNEGGRPDVWNYTFEFVVIKNEMQQRII